MLNEKRGVAGCTGGGGTEAGGRGSGQTGVLRDTKEKTGDWNE